MRNTVSFSAYLNAGAVVELIEVDDVQVRIFLHQKNHLITTYSILHNIFEVKKKKKRSDRV